MAIGAGNFRQMMPPPVIFRTTAEPLETDLLVVVVVVTVTVMVAGVNRATEEGAETATAVEVVVVAAGVEPAGFWQPTKDGKGQIGNLVHGVYSISSIIFYYIQIIKDVKVILHNSAPWIHQEQQRHGVLV